LVLQVVVVLLNMMELHRQYMQQPMEHLAKALLVLLLIQVFLLVVAVVEQVVLQQVSMAVQPLQLIQVGVLMLHLLVLAVTAAMNLVGLGSLVTATVPLEFTLQTTHLKAPLMVNKAL
jgi:hypothetical protein